jgi:hypothetical protein
MLGWKFCIKFDCHPSWITTAGNFSGQNVFPLMDHAIQANIERIINGSATVPFREVWPGLAWLVAFEPSKKGIFPFDNVSSSVKFEAVGLHLPKLLERLNKATSERGKKTALANFLGVSLAMVSQWLSGKREPGGETTLKLLHWVEQQERKK